MKHKSHEENVQYLQKVLRKMCINAQKSFDFCEKIKYNLYKYQKRV